MELLKKRIVSDGIIKTGNVVKVDSFLNHQMDISLLDEIGKEFKRLFSDLKPTKILTIEASGIGIACLTARYFNVPVVFAKKVQSKNLDDDIYTSQVFSFTHGIEYKIRVSKKYLTSNDKVIVIDDFLANGKALDGLLDVISQAGAELLGIGIVIEKGFQEGGLRLREKGYNLKSLAIIDSIENGVIRFRD